MELKLTVLAGAKTGTSIPLKKSEFIIGRSSECTLRAGSDAISRRHCKIVRSDEGWLASDMGSRNGTFVNDQRITEATLLKVGDELTIGPLKFRIDPLKAKAKVAEPQPSASAKSTPGIKKVKQPPVKSVADVAERTAKQSAEDNFEDDISRWLIGVETGAKTLQETVNLKMEDTTAINSDKPTVANDPAEVSTEDAAATDDSKATDEQDDSSSDDSSENGSAEDAKTKSGRWKALFGRGSKGKGGEKKAGPGKLPKRPEKEKTKDSCEAAADILREMTRRR